MIRVKYSATEREDLVHHFSCDADKAESKEECLSSPIKDIEEQIKNSAPIFNYASFFGDGIDLDDKTIELGDTSDYYGYILRPPQNESQNHAVTISFFAYGYPPLLENGITVEFNKYTCKRVGVVRDGIELGYVENENGLPEKVHIKFEKPAESWLNLDIVFSGFLENQPINIKGIILGNNIEITDIMSFDMISETNPIGDDLAMNEANISAVIAEDFSGYQGQEVTLIDNDEVLENDALNSIEEIDENVYSIKSRNIIQDFDEEEADYFMLDFMGKETSDREPASYAINFNDVKCKVGDLISYELGLDVEIPDEASKQYISQYMHRSSKRKILQQIAWACCCGIDTTYSDKIRFIPFFAPEPDANGDIPPVVPDITITNENDRILKTSVRKGKEYSKIVWHFKKYKLKREYSEDGADDGSVPIVSVDNIPYNKWIGKRYLETTSDIPVKVYTDSNDFTAENITPFKYAIEANFDYDEDSSGYFGANILGWEYVEYEEEKEISLSNPKGKILDISNQILYPLDISKKEAQLQKWYSNNNTLSATIVDNDSEIRLGKVVKIQLKKGNYFQGIVTKIVRNNIGDYHTVDLEAHEWN